MAAVKFQDRGTGAGGRRLSAARFDAVISVL
jgi:hypothetical protein